MRRIVVGLVMAGLLAMPGGTAAQTTSPPPSTLLCVNVAGPGPWDAASLMTALIAGEATIVSVTDPLSCLPDQTTGGAAGVGETVLVEDTLAITVDRVVFGGPPRSSKKTLVAFHLQYEGLADGGYSTSADWSAYADDILLEPVYYAEGLGPLLPHGDLPSGRRTSGWVVFTGDMARRSEVVLSYRAGSIDPELPFDVVVRCCKNVEP